MRYLSILIILISFSCTTEKSKSSIDPAEIKNIINTNLDQWHEDAAEANFNPYFNLFSSTGVYIGTDASEVWSVKEFKAFSKPYFNKGKAWSFKAKERNIYLSKDDHVIWFDELLDTWMGTCRGSGVFQKYNGKWKLEHYVLSLTIPNEKMDSVISVIE